MTGIDQLGRRHRKLLADLAALRVDLAEAIRAEHATGATYADLMMRSGYTSLETIRQILAPEKRDEINRRRRERD
jgi:hypothetical protein